MKKEINIEERVAEARKLHNEGYNCTQSVVLAYADIMDMDRGKVAQLTAPFGSGLARLREVCGTVSGMAILASAIAPAGDPSNRTAVRENIALVQDLAGKFRAENGDIVCRRLLGLDGSGIKKKPCAEYVACAARLVGEKLQELNNENNGKE